MTERVRAVIYQGKKLLLLKRIKPEETFWAFPGGAVEVNENHKEALKRECKEELGVDVEVGDLFFKKLSDKPKTKGQLELYYWCTVVGGQIGSGSGPEFQPNSHYVGEHKPEWVDFSLLPNLDVKPHEVRDLVVKKFQNPTQLKNEVDICRLIEKDEWMMAALKEVQKLDLPDWWIGAGFVRNKVWDTLHNFNKRTPLGDIDVIYFDPANRSENSETQYQKELSMNMPGENWSVTNQVRMSTFNNDEPYVSSIDALSKWPETATCIAVKLDGSGKVIITAPHGVTDLLGLIVRPSPTFNNRPEKFEARLKKKNWGDTWPKLRFEVGGVFQNNIHSTGVIQ